MKLFQLDFQGKSFLKPVSAIFYQVFMFSPNASFLKTKENVFYFI